MILRLTGKEVADALLVGLRAQRKLGEGTFGVQFSWSDKDGLVAEVGPPFVDRIPPEGRLVTVDEKAVRRREP